MAQPRRRGGTDPGPLRSRYFLDPASLDQSLATDIKERSHALTLEVLKPFKGRFFYLVAEAHSVPT